MPRGYSWTDRRINQAEMRRKTYSQQYEKQQQERFESIHKELMDRMPMIQSSASSVNRPSSFRTKR